MIFKLEGKGGRARGGEGGREVALATVDMEQPFGLGSRRGVVDRSCYTNNLGEGRVVVIASR